MTYLISYHFEGIRNDIQCQGFGNQTVITTGPINAKPLDVIYGFLQSILISEKGFTSVSIVFLNIIPLGE